MVGNLPLDSMLDSTLTGIYIADRKGDYVFANVGFLKMSGGEVSDIARMNVFNMEKDNYVKQSAPLTAFREKRRVTMINHVDNHKGYFYNQLITATPLFDGNGEVEYVVVEMLNLEMLGNELDSFYRFDRTDDHLFSSQNPVEMVAASPAMRRVRELADSVAPLDTTVLLTGETGTGKDVLARYIHEHSEQRNKKIVEIYTS